MRHNIKTTIQPIRRTIPHDQKLSKAKERNYLGSLKAATDRTDLSKTFT